MKNTELQTLATAIRAETDQSVIDALAIRNDTALAEWCNSNSNTDAWSTSVSSRELFESTDIAKFDNLSAGKRDAYRLLLAYTPVDASRNKIRKALSDIWGTTDSVSLLSACIRKATNAEVYLGGTSATTDTVTGLKLNFNGYVSVDDVSIALNKY